MQGKRKPASFVLWAVAFLLIALVVPPSAHGQETRGRIIGRVLDSSKAVVPGATVVVTDKNRGTQSTTTSNAQGLFTISYLLPGAYKLTVELEGFKTHVSDDIALQIAETRSLDITLEVGTMKETVSVTAEVQTVNTADANLGLVVDQARLASLPLIHGDPYKIMGLATGLAHTGDPRLDRPFEPTHIIGYAFDGTRGNRSDLLIDGAPSTATANANEVIATYVPPSDLVQEFRVQTATFDAQFGNTEGGVTSMVIKSGTNRFRGSAYYFMEPSAWGANDYFGLLRGQPKVDSNSNRPGGTIGGPVFKDKTFFMFGYERITDKRPRFDAAGTSWVPTDAMRSGDLSAYLPYIKIYDPLTRKSAGSGTYTATAFTNNVIPQNRINPIAKAVLGFYSAPKNPGSNPASGPAGNITDATLAEQTKAYNTVTGRVDQKISGNNRMFARYSWYERNSHYNDYLASVASGTLFQFISYQAVVDDVHIFNPTTVLNVRFGYNRFDRNSDMEKPAAWGFDITQLGFPSALNSAIDPVVRRFPRLDFPGGQMVSVAYGADYRPVTSHTIAATLNKTKGAHALKFGVEIRRYGERSRSTGNNQSGQYGFDNTYTRPSSSSSSDYEGLQAYAAFLLGMPSTSSITRSPTYDEHSFTNGFFTQDDWRVNDKLTLNLGLRYEVENPLVEAANKSVSGFDYDYVQPIQAAAQAKYATLTDTAANPSGRTLKDLVPTLSVKGGLKFEGVDGPLYTTPKNTFLPRFGFAYQVAQRTVIRGGIGLFAGFLGERRGDVIQSGFSQTTTAGTTLNANGAPVPQYWDNALVNTGIIEPVGNAAGRQTYLGQGISFFNPNPSVSKQLRYQIGVQRELAPGLSVEAAYVGNYGYDIEITRNINALPAQYLNTDNARTAAMEANNKWLTGTVANPFAGMLPGTSLNNSTISRQQLLLPYPEFGTINTTNNDGKSWYNAGQFGLQKRFSGGYTIGVSYTYSKWMQATEYLNASDATPTKMISDLDVTNRLSVSGILALPFGKGRHFMGDASGVADAIVGGWQVQGVYTYQSGFPIPFGTDLYYNGGEIAISSDQRTTNKWFDTSTFTSVLDSGTTSTTASTASHQRTLPLRFTEVRRDNINNVDMSLLKDIRFKGDVRAQIRFEFTNFLNHPYFANPVVNPTSAQFGQIASSNQANYARRAQIGFKLLF